MAHSPPRLLPKGTQRVLLVDPFQPTREARSRVLRARGVEVATARDLVEARVLFMPRQHDLVLLDTRRYPSAEVLVFCRIIKDLDPDQRIALLLGAPNYLTLDWKKELASVTEPPQHLRSRAKRHVAAA